MFAPAARPKKYVIALQNPVNAIEPKRPDSSASVSFSPVLCIQNPAISGKTLINPMSAIANTVINRLSRWAAIAWE